MWYVLVKTEPSVDYEKQQSLLDLYLKPLLDPAAVGRGAVLLVLVGHGLDVHVHVGALLHQHQRRGFVTTW